MKYNIKVHHIVDSRYKELGVSAMLHIKEGSVVNGRPWRRAKTPSHQPACGAAIAEYGIVAPPSFTKLDMESQKTASNIRHGRYLTALKKGPENSQYVFA
ncbi:hypothetical protein A2U01_0016573 [Trifolium medium]|uniref:Uncharacterized protein n=1 Tax=Trifolium medium TaxID=97028 RepID=A0A392N7Q1_9FABA|nr:hypothetical protein [Trifolium medium]